MTTNHIDHLAEWWEGAEDAPASPGDRIIERHVCESDDDTYYTIGTHREGMRGLIGKSGTRILSRAPKPKPAWANARAIIAHTDENPRPSVWTWHKPMERWDDEGGCHWAYTEDLRDVTPLIEAKVTSEMARTALNGYYEEDDDGCTWSADTVTLMRLALTAALGLETA